MPIQGINQPDFIQVDEQIRLRKFAAPYDFALAWYQDPETVWMVDGNREPYTRELLDKMYDWWSKACEVYFIEVVTDEGYQPIGDVSFMQEDMPIVIGDPAYRGQGIATKVIRRMIERGRELGYKELEIEGIYTWNKASQKLYTNLGFQPFKEGKDEMSYKLIL